MKAWDRLIYASLQQLSRRNVKRVANEVKSRDFVKTLQKTLCQNYKIREFFTESIL